MKNYFLLSIIGFFKDKSKIRFWNVEEFKTCIILIDSNDNSIEYYEIRDQRFFKCKLSDYCLFRIKIFLLCTLSNRNGKIVNYRINGYIQHNHTKEVLEYNKNELEKRDIVKMEEDLAELRNELSKAIKAPKTKNIRVLY